MPYIIEDDQHDPDMVGREDHPCIDCKYRGNLRGCIANTCPNPPSKLGFDWWCVKCEEECMYWDEEEGCMPGACEYDHDIVPLPKEW